jgi:hypothetical protein
VRYFIQYRSPYDTEWRPVPDPLHGDMVMLVDCKEQAKERLAEHSIGFTPADRFRLVSAEFRL